MTRLRFGPKIKKIRVRLGMTQAELGRKLDPHVSPATISQWENENHSPSDRHKQQLQGILGQSSNDTATKIGAEAEQEEAAEEEEAVVSPSAIGAWLNKRRLAQNYSVPELASRTGLSAVAIYNIESGRSQNPQRSTVAKLEKALKLKLSSEAKSEAREEATIEGVGEWFDFDPNSEADWPNVAGIYVLYDVSDRPVYVGQGMKIAMRLRDHREKFWFKPPIVQNAAYVGIESKVLREKIEKVLIKFLKSNAVLNQQNVER